MQLCGSHLHFYACTHRAARPVTPIYRASSAPRKPYVCLAPDEVHCSCPQRDVDGQRHRAAGITINQGEPDEQSK